MKQALACLLIFLTSGLSLRAHDLGTIEKGKLADLVLLDANPLRDIRNTQKINAVVVNGRCWMGRS